MRRLAALALALLALPTAQALEAAVRVPVPTPETTAQPLEATIQRGPVQAAPRAAVVPAPVAALPVALPVAHVETPVADVTMSEEALDARIDLPLATLAVRATPADAFAPTHARAAGDGAALHPHRATRALTVPARHARELPGLPHEASTAPAPQGAPPPASVPPAAPPAPAPTAAATSVRTSPTPLATVVSLALGALLLLAPLALYHRIRGRETLEQETRAKLYELLRAKPGLTPTDASREVGCDAKTASYHFQRLVKEGFAATEGPARRLRYFAAGETRASERPQLVAANAHRDVLEEIARQPGLTKTQLSDACGIARPTLSWHLRRLADAGLVRFERDGRGVRVHSA